MQAAEEVIVKMRQHLNDLYQFLVNPSDSSAYDVLEDSELFRLIQNEIEKLKTDVREYCVRNTSESL